MQRDFAPGCRIHFYERLFFKFEKRIAGKPAHAAGVAHTGFACICLLFLHSGFSNFSGTRGDFW
jgi:hypothetical protein